LQPIVKISIIKKVKRQELKRTLSKMTIKSYSNTKFQLIQKRKRIKIMKIKRNQIKKTKVSSQKSIQNQNLIT